MESRHFPEGDARDGGGRGDYAAVYFARVTQCIRPAWCHREDSNLYQRPSQCRVPSLERWRVNDEDRSASSSSPNETGEGRSRWSRTITHADMSRDGALHGLRDKGYTRSGYRSSRSGSDGLDNPVPGALGVRDGSRTRVARWKDGSTWPLYDTDAEQTTAATNHGQGTESSRTFHRGIGWVRTNGHPVNNRPLNQLSFDPRYRRVATPAAVAGPRLHTAA